MPWPPKPGELLPRAEEPLGVRRKLVQYSLDEAHRVGGHKARGFAQILGITIDELAYLESWISTEILNTPVSSVRDNKFRGFNCVVEFPLRGLGGYRERIVDLRTVWHLLEPDSRPRLLTAFPTT